MNECLCVVQILWHENSIASALLCTTAAVSFSSCKSTSDYFIEKGQEIGQADDRTLAGRRIVVMKPSGAVNNR
jgi:hypothetical protein